MVLVFIKAVSNSGTFDTEAGRNMLDMVMGNCDFWLVDVPKIMSLIHKPLGCINTAPARRSVESLIVQMADKCPGEVVSTLLTIAPPGDSTALALWEVMFSVPQTLQNVLKELLIQLQDRHYRVLYTHWVDTTILRLAVSYWKKLLVPQELHGARSPSNSAGRSLLACFQMLASSDLQDEEFAPMYLVMRFLRQRRPTVFSLLLRAMMTLSQRGEMVSGVSPRAAMVAAKGRGSGFGLGLGWQSGAGVPAPKALPVMVGPGGCLGSSPVIDVVPRWKLSSSYRPEK
nr:uncharacterized protein LOC110356050 [Columba livia]